MSDEWHARGLAECAGTNELLEIVVHGNSRADVEFKAISEAQNRCRYYLGTRFEEWLDPGLEVWNEQAVNRSMALDTSGGNGNIFLHTEPDFDNINHRWTFVPVANTVDTYMIYSASPRGVIDANNGTGLPYIHPEPDHNNKNHCWKVSRIGGHPGIRTIVSVQTGGALDANWGRHVYLNNHVNDSHANHRWIINPDSHQRMILWFKPTGPEPEDALNTGSLKELRSKGHPHFRYIT